MFYVCLGFVELKRVLLFYFVIPKHKRIHYGKITGKSLKQDRSPIVLLEFCSFRFIIYICLKQFFSLLFNSFFHFCIVIFGDNVMFPTEKTILLTKKTMIGSVRNNGVCIYLIYPSWALWLIVILFIIELLAFHL
jgi:hypothetical protein